MVKIMEKPIRKDDLGGFPPILGNIYTLNRKVKILTLQMTGMRAFGWENLLNIVEIFHMEKLVIVQA